MACTRLLLIVVLSCVLFTPSESASCCLRYYQRPVPCHRMTGFTIQTISSSCDLQAVIFHTKDGRFMCADPAKKWTMRVLKCLLSRKTD
ncbi:C-C motif chemokine 20b [Hypomesus transpacificus]|uniref:C-C motif chemokine 20b n=1 Tax=Hypomesus transpacificus TaxID=137520 RepID=UPI001F07F4E1|nr:C-C motif chemokine 20b [Hypomesus transpacificus]